MPSIPGVITVSFSELDAFRQCPLKWYLGYVERWTRPIKPGGALDKGIVWHRVMETHYKTIARERDNALLKADAIEDTGDKSRKPEVAALRLAAVTDEELLLKACREAITPHLFHPRTGEPLNDTCELVSWMYDGYVEKWGGDTGWRILAVEHGPVVPLYTPRGGMSRFRLKLKVDLVIYDLSLDGRLWLVDHKSGQNLPSDKELDIDDQFGLYTYALKKLGQPVFGSRHNAARTQRNKSAMRLEDRFRRTPLYRSDVELGAIAEDAYLTCMRMYGDRPTGEGGVAGVGINSSPDPDRCRWRCDFLEPHLLARKGNDLRQTLLDLGFEQNFTRH